jgi:hypothetical protein
VSYHPRTDWQTSQYPITGPTSQPSAWQYNTLHWPGGSINVNDPVGVLRAWQQSWCVNKDYSLGYNFCVFPDGSQWEVRGFDIKCAANGSAAVNTPGIAINLCVANVNTAPSVSMVEGVVDLIEQTRAIAPYVSVINGHRDVRPEPTSCPGEVIYSWIQQGIFEPGSTTPRRRQLPRLWIDDEEDMAKSLIKDDKDNWFAFSGNALTWIWGYEGAVALQHDGIIPDVEPTQIPNVQIQHYINHCWTGGRVPDGYTQPDPDNPR